MSDKKFPLRVEVRPLLSCGGCGFGDGSIFIMLADDLQRQDARVTAWHEVIHILKMAGGQMDGHNESQVDDMAVKLADACPEILEMLGVEDKFK